MPELLQNKNREGVVILPSHPRPDSNRLLNAPMLEFDLASVIERIKGEEEWISGKHNAITLTKSAGMSIVLIAMHRENEMKIHQEEGALSLYIITGKLRFTSDTEFAFLHKHSLIAMHENIKYELLAIEESIFLLTSVAPTDSEKKLADNKKI